MKIKNRSRQDEEMLVMAATKGDLDAFNQLVLVYQDLAYQQAYWLLGDPDSAEDVTQDSFLKAFQALSSFRGSSFRGWLLRIVTNSAYDILRRSQRHPRQPLFPEGDNGEELESASWLADPATSVQQAVEQKELSEKVSVLIDQLPKTYRDVLMLVDLYEFDYAEVAETMHIPIGTVKSRLARARLQMQEKLKSMDDFIHRAADSQVGAVVKVF
jgi:RNA polymerase sigma-70 factor (ECF subfamily)